MHVYRLAQSSHRESTLTGHPEYQHPAHVISLHRPWASYLLSGPAWSLLANYAHSPPCTPGLGKIHIHCEHCPSSWHSSTLACDPWSCSSHWCCDPHSPWPAKELCPGHIPVPSKWSRDPCSSDWNWHNSIHFSFWHHKRGGTYTPRLTPLVGNKSTHAGLGLASSWYLVLTALTHTGQRVRLHREIVKKGFTEIEQTTVIKHRVWSNKHIKRLHFIWLASFIPISILSFVPPQFPSPKYSLIDFGTVPPLNSQNPHVSLVSLFLSVTKFRWPCRKAVPLVSWWTIN